MTGISFGDLAQSYLLKSRIGGLKSQTLRLANELASGRKSDLSSSLSGDLTGLSFLEHARARAQGFLTASRDMAMTVDTRQTILGAISDHLTAMANSVGLSSRDAEFSQIVQVADEARALFSESVQKLNTHIAGRPVFAGVATNGAALREPTSILAELKTLTNSASTPSEIETIVTNWFEDPAGFSAFAYQGSEAGDPVILSSEGLSVSGTTAEDPGVKAALKGLALASLMDHPALSPTGADRMELKSRAHTLLLAGTSAVTDLSARIGADQSKIDSLQSRYQAEDLSFQKAISDLVSADPAQTATELEAVRTNLETVYSVTARISRLTLSDFLR